MIFAFGNGEEAAGRFRASLAIAIMVPVLAYGFVLLYRVLNGRRPAPSGKIKNIIFDVGNVLVRYDWRGYLESFGFPQEETKVLSQEIFLSRTWREQDRGAKTDEEYLAAFIAAAPQYEEDVVRVWKDAGRTIRPVDYADSWTQYLRSRGYRLFVLSNYASRLLEDTKHHMTFLPNMDGVIFSCDVKQIKPEPEIYHTLLDRYGLKADECVFMDDVEENCEGARRCGIHAIRFENLKQAAAELEKLGVS